MCESPRDLNCDQQKSANKGACVVFCDELALKYAIPYSYLYPLPVHHNSNGAFDELLNEEIENCAKGEGFDSLKRGSQFNNHNQFTDLLNSKPNSHKIIAMPGTNLLCSDYPSNRSSNRNTNVSRQANKGDPHAPTAPLAGEPIDFNQTNVNNADDQPQLHDVQDSNAAYVGDNQEIVQYYLSPIPQYGNAVQMPYPMTSAEVFGYQNVIQTPLAYRSHAPNSMVPIDHWSNYNLLIHASGMFRYSIIINLSVFACLFKTNLTPNFLVISNIFLIYSITDFIMV